MSALNSIGTPFIELLTVESTNNYAMGLIRAGMAQHGTVVFTHEQTKGKGQRNKKWVSQKDRNIAMSTVMEPSFMPSSQLFLFSMMAATAVRELVHSYALDEVSIKWANDIYWRDRKAAGILIENLWQGKEWKYSIVGIGININQTDFGELEQRAISLKQITGKEFIPVKLAKELSGLLEKKYWQLINEPGSVMEEYRSHLYMKNETVKFKKDNRIFNAVVKDVTINGELVVQHTIEERFSVGEVEWWF